MLEHQHFKWSKRDDLVITHSHLIDHHTKQANYTQPPHSDSVIDASVGALLSTSALARLKFIKAVGLVS